MASKHSNSTGKEANYGKAKLQDSVLPADLQIMVMERDVANNYPVIHIRSVKDFENIVEEIKVNTEDGLGWKDMKGPIETALFSTAAFRLRIYFLPQTNGSVVARIPDPVSEIKPRIRNLYLTFLSEGSGFGINPSALGDGRPYIRAARGVASLREQFPNLHVFVIYLIANADTINDQIAGDGFWAVRRLRINATGNWITLLRAVTNILKAAQMDGPGEKKLFRLSMELNDAADERLHFARFGRYENSSRMTTPFDPMTWKPWAVHSEVIDFSLIEFHSTKDADLFIARMWADRSGNHIMHGLIEHLADRFGT